MSSAWVVLLLVMLGGALTALQAPTNALLSRGVGSPVNAALVSFLVGTVVLAACAAVLAVRPSSDAMRALPWYAWTGGAYGAFFVAIAAYAAPRIGIAPLLVFLIAGQLVAAVALDHFGALGLARQTVTPTRLLGVLLVLAGAIVVRRS
jgi:transporter family-2 protein